MRLKGIVIFLMAGLFTILPYVSMGQESSNDPDKLGAPNVIKGGKSASSKHKMTSAEKKVEDAKKQRMKDAAKAEKAAKKFHEKIQSKSTKEMMKNSKNKADAYNGNKRDPWWKRLFRKKSHSS